MICKREFVRRLVLGGVGLVGGASLGDEYVATSKALPPGSVGEPDNVSTGGSMSSRCRGRLGGRRYT